MLQTNLDGPASVAVAGNIQMQPLPRDEEQKYITNLTAMRGYGSEKKYFQPLKASPPIIFKWIMVLRSKSILIHRSKDFRSMLYVSDKSSLHTSL
jgi:hypothetical protein